MSPRIQEHIDRITTAREQVMTQLERIGDRADEQIYSEGAMWTLGQLAIHLMISDKGHNRMLMTIAQDEELIPPDYDLDRFNKRSVEKSPDVSVDDAIAGLKASRAELLEWLGTIDDATLDKKGRHATLRILSIAEIMDVMVFHEAGHADDIKTHMDKA